MAKKKMTFTINISPSGESYLEYPVTAKERRLILEAMDNGDFFEDVEGLSELYERVMEAAKEKLAEDLDLTGDDRNPEDFEYSVEFGEEEDDEW